MVLLNELKVPCSVGNGKGGWEAEEREEGKEAAFCRVALRAGSLSVARKKVWSERVRALSSTQQGPRLRQKVQP